MSTENRTTIANALRQCALGFITQDECRQIILSVYLRGNTGELHHE